MTVIIWKIFINAEEKYLFWWIYCCWVWPPNINTQRKVRHRWLQRKQEEKTGVGGGVLRWTGQERGAVEGGRVCGGKHNGRLWSPTVVIWSPRGSSRPRAWITAWSPSAAAAALQSHQALQEDAATHASQNTWPSQSAEHGWMEEVWTQTLLLLSRKLWQAFETTASLLVRR